MIRWASKLPFANSSCAPCQYYSINIQCEEFIQKLWLLYPPWKKKVQEKNKALDF